jgi:hypothetical protein
MTFRYGAIEDDEPALECGIFGLPIESQRSDHARVVGYLDASRWSQWGGIVENIRVDGMLLSAETCIGQDAGEAALANAVPAVDHRQPVRERKTSRLTGNVIDLFPVLADAALDMSKNNGSPGPATTRRTVRRRSTSQDLTALWLVIQPLNREALLGVGRTGNQVQSQTGQLNWQIDDLPVTAGGGARQLAGLTDSRRYGIRSSAFHEPS